MTVLTEIISGTVMLVSKMTFPRFALIFVILLLVSCSEAPTPTAPLPTATTVPPSPTSPPVQTPSPTFEPIPTGLIRLPVPDSARQTAAALMAAEHPPFDHNRVAIQILGLSPDQLEPELTIGPDLEINDRANFFVNANLGGEYRSFPARLRHLTENVAWWASVDARVTDEDIIAAADYFEEVVRPTNRLIFGPEASPGIDNDHRIHFLLVEEPTWGGVFGYFSSKNQLPTAIEPFSNQREMLVINVTAFNPTSDTFPGKLAHEYQHLIQWNRDQNEDLWLNEGLSELAYFLTDSPVVRCRGCLTNEEYFAENTEIQLTSRPERSLGEEDRSALMHYGAEKTFLIYLLEQFGPEFVKELAANEAPGVISIQQELDRLPDAPRFSEVYASWLVANMVNQPSLSEGQFGYQEYKPAFPEREIVNSFRGETISDSLPPYGARYYEIQTDEAVNASFTGSTLARLTPADPPEGEYAWYSNRGNESEFSLTREFDLTGLEIATLTYKVWYELDEFFDYGYLEVSTDGGQTWTILETYHGTDEDPNDRAFGVGYTGATLDWLEESIDLTPYAGQVILLRFEVFTDFTVNRDGLQLDEIEIPELGYFDGAEDGTGGWEVHGFVRSTNLVPADWVVWTVEIARPLRITRIDVGSGQNAEFEFADFSPDFPFAFLIVSPTAPVTTMELDYELVFRHP